MVFVIWTKGLKAHVMQPKPLEGWKIWVHWGLVAGMYDKGKCQGQLKDGGEIKKNKSLLSKYACGSVSMSAFSLLGKQTHTQTDMPWREVDEQMYQGVCASQWTFPDRVLGEWHQWPMQLILLVHGRCGPIERSRRIMARPGWWKPNDSPDDGESLVVDLKVTVVCESSTFWLFLGVRFCQWCDTVQLWGKSVKLVAACVLCAFVYSTCCFESQLMKATAGLFLLLLQLRKAQVTQVVLCMREQNPCGTQGPCVEGANEERGHLVWLFIYPVRKWQNSFLSSLSFAVLFARSVIFTPFFVLCNDVFHLPFQLPFLMKVGAWLKLKQILKSLYVGELSKAWRMLLIYCLKETCCNYCVIYTFMVKYWGKGV